jgi:hypothetical protein
MHRSGGNTYEVLVGKSRRRQLGTAKHGCKNGTEMDFKEIGYKVVHYIYWGSVAGLCGKVINLAVK